MQDDFALSPVQQGIYFHHLHRKNRVYVEQMLCDVLGPVDLELFERVVNRLVEAHECLRTVFVPGGHDGPRQVVQPYRPRRLRHRDLSTLPDPDRAFARDVADDMARHFDVAVEPSRCELVKLGPDRHTFLWSYSHLITDSWSVRVMEEQFCELYASALEGRAAPELPRVPYRRYIEWIERQDPGRAAAYWRGYLAGLSGRADAALPSPDIDEHKVAVTVDCGPRARELIGALARRHRATVNHVVLAAWGAYLLDHFQRAEAVFGCVVSGRMIRLPDVDRMGGLFVNAIPVRVREADTVAQTISQVRHHTIQSGEHSYLALSDIMACGDTTTASLSTVVNFQIDRVDLDDPKARSLPFQVRNIRCHEQAHYDAYLDVYLGDRDLRLVIHHDPRRHGFDAAAVRLALLRILQQFDAGADASLGDVVLRVMGAALPACGALDFSA